MKATVLSLGVVLSFAVSAQAAVTPKEKPCTPVNVVQRALNSVSLTDVKGQIARRLNLPVNRLEAQHKFSFEGQQINRVRRVGNACNYYTPSSSEPVYTIKD